MTTILCGAIVFYLGGKADTFTKQIGGKIDNSFGQQLQNDTKTIWGNVKKIGSMAYKDWLKKK